MADLDDVLAELKQITHWLISIDTKLEQLSGRWGNIEVEVINEPLSVQIQNTPLDVNVENTVTVEGSVSVDS